MNTEYFIEVKLISIQVLVNMHLIFKTTEEVGRRKKVIPSIMLIIGSFTTLSRATGMILVIQSESDER